MVSVQRIFQLFFYVSFAIILLTSTDTFAGRSSDGVYIIATDLLGSAGGISADSGYQLHASIGQPAQGNISDSTRTILAGFLNTAKSLTKPKSNIFLLIIPAITSQAGQ